MLAIEVGPGADLVFLAKIEQRLQVPAVVLAR
jgi:hypothetical protein